MHGQGKMTLYFILFHSLSANTGLIKEGEYVNGVFVGKEDEESVDNSAYVYIYIYIYKYNVEMRVISKYTESWNTKMGTNI